MKFKVIHESPVMKEPDTVYLKYIPYDDYGYCTSFNASYISQLQLAEEINLGNLKIGYENLAQHVEAGVSRNGYGSYSVIDLMPTDYFDILSDSFFSLGEDASYYKTIFNLMNNCLSDYCMGLRDIALDFNRFKSLYQSGERCLINSLMRSIHYPNVEQFSRIINGDAELTDYNIAFKYNDEEIAISVTPNSLPPSNIHVLIGRNGVGKTWLLYHMMHSILVNMGIRLNESQSIKYILDRNFHLLSEENLFAGAIGVSFSVFDDAFSSITLDSSSSREEIYENSAETNRVKDEFNKKYKYIGLVLKNQKDGRTKVKSIDNFADEFQEMLTKIKNVYEKQKTYLEMCQQLNTDPMFNDNGFIDLLSDYLYDKEKLESVIKQFKRLSSGHMIIILSLTLLYESVFEKTVVLIDEPETHLHPPLLSTYIRTLSFLLRKKNAVAIIATHSPIVVQEAPSACVTKIERTQKMMCFSRPEIESFAANTDSLTRDIFGYEVIKTGFYKLLESEIEDSFEKTFKKFDKKIGFLGQIMIQRIIKRKEDAADEEN